MKHAAKKRLNLTIESRILERARLLAEFRGSSISSLVEDFLARLASNQDTEAEADQSLDSIEDFHKRFLKNRRSEPSNSRILAIKNERLKSKGSRLNSIRSQ